MKKLLFIYIAAHCLYFPVCLAGTPLSQDSFSVRAGILDSLQINSLSTYQITITPDPREKAIIGISEITLPEISSNRRFIFSLDSQLVIENLTIDGRAAAYHYAKDYPTLQTAASIYSILVPDTIDRKKSHTLKIVYSGFLESFPEDLPQRFSSAMEFGDGFRWFPLFLDDFSYYLMVNVYVPNGYQIYFSYEGAVERARKPEAPTQLRWSSPISQGGFCILRGAKTYEKKFADNSCFRIQYFNLKNAEVEELGQGIEYIIGRFNNFLGNSRMPYRIEIICSPRTGAMYRCGLNQVVIPEQEMKFPLFNWKDYPEAFYLIAQVVGGYRWRICPSEWLREGLIAYCAHLTVERMFGYELIRQWSDEAEQNFIASLAHFNLLSLRDKKELLYHQKLPFIFRMLNHQAGGSGVESTLETVLKKMASMPYGKPDYSTLQKLLFAETGQSLRVFFKQWFEILDVPRIKFSYGVNAISSNKFRVSITIDQGDGAFFEFPLDFIVRFKNEEDRRRIYVPLSPFTFSIIYPQIPQQIEFSPDNYVLNR